MGRNPRPGRGKSGKGNLLGRSLDLLRDMSGRLQKEAERAWRLSGLRVEAATLRRKRVEALVRLGEALQKKIQAGEITSDDLNGLSGRIAHLERKLRHAERTIGRAAHLASSRRAASEDKAPRKSQRLELVRAAEEGNGETPAAATGKRAERGRKSVSSDSTRAAGSGHRRASAATAPRPRPAAVAPSRLPIDPLEDILGTAEDIRIEELPSDEPAASPQRPGKPRQH